MKVITGGKELIGSETFIALGEGETEISLDDSSESIRFIFSFVESDNNDTDGCCSGCCRYSVVGFFEI